MNDELIYKVVDLIQNAQGAITITDYTQLAGKTITINATVLTEGTSFNRGASNDACATALATAINALANINAAATGPVVTVQADAPGTAGNAYGMATNATEGITLSAATLLGGVAATFTPAIQLTDEESATQVDTVIDIQAAAGTGKTLTVTPQTSFDKATWIDRTASAALSTVAVTELHTTEPLTFWRYKLVLGGTVNPKFSVNITGKKSK